MLETNRAPMIAAALALATAACIPAAYGVRPISEETERKIQAGEPIFVANIERIDVTPKVSARRLSVAVPLRIVIDAQVEDAFMVKSTDNMVSHFTNHRDSVARALQQSFVSNFPEVSVVPTESKQGLELIVLRAEILRTHTFKYHVVLTHNGVEKADVTGESEGISIATRGHIEDQIREYPNTVRRLVEYSLGDMCEKIYDATMRDERLLAERFWERLGQ